MYKLLPRGWILYYHSFRFLTCEIFQDDHLRFTKASIRLSSSSSSSSSTSATCFVGCVSFEGVGFITFGIGTTRFAFALVAGAARFPLPPFGSSGAGGAAISSSSPMTLPLTDALAGALPVSLVPWCWTLRLLCVISFSVTARSSAVSRFSFSNSLAVRKEKGGAENLLLGSEKGFGDESSS